MKVVLASFSVLFCAGVADAHIAMTFPTPRTSSQKAGPCGAAGSTRGSNVTHFAPGETITVEWDETVNHPGHFRISLNMDGDSFQNPSTPDDNFPETLVEPIQDKSGGHYTQEVTLPDTPCDNCTLQLVQVMTTSVPFNSFYFQCADITIGEGGGGGGGGDGGGDGSGGGGGGGDPEEVGGCSTSSGAGLGVAALVLADVLRKRRR